MADKILRTDLHCPLCGGPNHCAVAACGRTDVACWCRDIRIHSHLIEQVSQSRRGESCICEQCARSFDVAVERNSEYGC